ncbi:FAD:protein FMN transferase [uncultured Polaribacter sp.]|uniref:FAD:protein FMN transferase n=1 Tax=uncultured Polaribacter sp. TaxID=174711 RepID=UPI00260A022F|nr:FAD:protein FMN transferase [uncultured Polaribacter sp.]
MKHLKYIHLLLFILILCACKEQKVSKDYTLKGFVFGTTYKIIYLDGKQNYQKDIDRLFQDINNSLSTYISTSDISKINAGDTSVIVDEYFVEVFKKSKRIFKETNGYFDPTVGNLVNAYGFGPKNEENNLSQEQIEKEMKFVGLNNVALQNNKIVKKYPEVYLDFNSIAKGYALDVIARFLEKNKVVNFLVEIGGEIRTKGTKKENKPWVIKLIDPVKSATNNGFKKINLSNKAMATSGNYRKFRILDDGTKYVHTINPKTGYALQSNLLSASIIGGLDCADLDAYATAFMAMGLQSSIEFLQKHPEIQAILIYTNNEGDLLEFTNYTYN